MTVDAYGLATSSGSPEARKAFEAAQRAVAGHRPQAGPALAETLAAAPDHIGALALKGFAQVLLARCELAYDARQSFEAAQRALTSSASSTLDERTLVGALGSAVAGDLRQSADMLDSGFAERPATLLPFKLAHQLRFMAGDRAGMLRGCNRMMRFWDETLPGAGFLLGCHAFALEEHARFEEAEAAGRLAVEIDPDDAWGLHAVSHVYEMTGRIEQGIAWLGQSRATWSGCNNFAFHVAWHLALYHLEQGDHETVLWLYDHDVRPTQTDDFRDISNAVSLLWRLESHGVCVGDRWDDLADALLRRQGDATLAFAGLHTLAGLLAIGADAAAGAIVDALRHRASGSDEQAIIARDVGLPVALFIVNAAQASNRRRLLAIVNRLPELGGSNAQRDFFLLWMTRQMVASGDLDGARSLMHVRRHYRDDDRLSRTVMPAAGPLASNTH
jgi:tetratricopeptide (TPR) repeat protein